MSDVFYICNGKDCDDCPFADCVRPDRYAADGELALDKTGKPICKREKDIPHEREQLPLSVYSACMEKITALRLLIDQYEREKTEIEEFLNKYGVSIGGQKG